MSSRLGVCRAGGSDGCSYLERSSTCNTFPSTVTHIPSWKLDVEVPWKREAYRCKDPKAKSSVWDPPHLVTAFPTHVLLPRCVPGYGGCIPGSQFHVGHTIGVCFGELFEGRRSHDHCHGFSRRPAKDLPTRSVNKFRHEDLPYQLTYENDARKNDIRHFYSQMQDYRDYYRDLTDTIKKVEKFSSPLKNEDLWRPQYPKTSYYLHHNRKPERGLPDCNWAYRDLVNNRYYHGYRDFLGRRHPRHKDVFPLPPSKLLDPGLFELR